MEKVIDMAFLDALWCQASESPRLRMNFDMRNSAADTSQRMLKVQLLILILTFLILQFSAAAKVKFSTSILADILYV